MSTDQPAASNKQPDNILPSVVGGVSSDDQTSTTPPLSLQAPIAADPSVQGMVSALPTEAQDTDLIEKEWVEKAKQIVESTSENPFVQQQELSKMKADYMKKRYNKDIKLSDQ
jgi:hypothetical protein